MFIKMIPYRIWHVKLATIDNFTGTFIGGLCDWIGKQCLLHYVYSKFIYFTFFQIRILSPGIGEKVKNLLLPVLTIPYQVSRLSMRGSYLLSRGLLHMIRRDIYRSTSYAITGSGSGKWSIIPSLWQVNFMLLYIDWKNVLFKSFFLPSFQNATAIGALLLITCFNKLCKTDFHH